MADFPERYVRVREVTYSKHGNEATVALLTNGESYLYPYFVHCVRESSGRWVETDSHTERDRSGCIPEHWPTRRSVAAGPRAEIAEPPPSSLRRGGTLIAARRASRPSV